MSRSRIDIRLTEDGSHTLFNQALGEPYHSLNGAINESMHVFIQAGFLFQAKGKARLRVLEIGMGTGLNTLLTAVTASRLSVSVHYTALEPFPPDPGLLKKLNYPGLVTGVKVDEVFEAIHDSSWNVESELHPGFILKKIPSKLEETDFSPGSFDLVYFDAFAPDVQPELWSVAIFCKLANASSPGAVLVTYAAKGQVRRNLQEAGFHAERLPGPKGKREMLRGTLHGPTSP